MKFYCSLWRDCPGLTGPFPLSSSMEQLAVYDDIDMTSQDTRQQPGEALPLAEDASKSSEVVKDGVPTIVDPGGSVGSRELSSDPRPFNSVACPDGHFYLGWGWSGSPTHCRSKWRISSTFWPPTYGLSFFGSAAFHCGHTDRPLHATISSPQALPDLRGPRSGTQGSSSKARS